MGEVGSALTSAKAILVTGGAGYIGAHVCEALAAAGYPRAEIARLLRTWDGSGIPEQRATA